MEFFATSVTNLTFLSAFLKEAKNNNTAEKPMMMNLQNQCQQRIEKAKLRIESYITNYASQQVNSITNAFSKLFSSDD